jgi:hypothetical protein
MPRHSPDLTLPLAEPITLTRGPCSHPDAFSNAFQAGAAKAAAAGEQAPVVQTIPVTNSNATLPRAWRNGSKSRIRIAASMSVTRPGMHPPHLPPRHLRRAFSSGSFIVRSFFLDAARRRARLPPVLVPERHEHLPRRLGHVGPLPGLSGDQNHLRRAIPTAGGGDIPPPSSYTVGFDNPPPRPVQLPEAAIGRDAASMEHGAAASAAEAERQRRLTAGPLHGTAAVVQPEETPAAPPIAGLSGRAALTARASAVLRGSAEAGPGGMRTAIVRSVQTNKVAIVLSVDALVLLIDEKLASLRDDRSNEAIAHYENLKEELEALRGVTLRLESGETKEETVENAANTFGEFVREWGKEITRKSAARPTKPLSSFRV